MSPELEAEPGRARGTIESPVPVFSVAVALNIAVLAVMWLTLSQSAALLHRAEQRTLQAVRLRGEIALYDEVLTMSARMAAASGDPSWEERYREHEPILAASISEAMRLVPTQGPSGARLTHASNLALVEMEHRALELVLAGQLEAAAALLSSAPYVEQKQVYVRGLEAYMDQVEGELREHVQLQYVRSRRAQLAALVASAGLVVGWVIVLRWFSRWRRKIQEAEASLALANATLEQRVTERTRELRRLAEGLLAAEERERERLALVLHDDLQQIMVSASLRLGAIDPTNEYLLEDLAAASAALHKALELSRSLSGELGQREVIDRGLPVAMRQLGKEMAERYGLRVTVDVPARLPPLPPGTETFLHRAAREVLFNVTKHAQVGEAWLSLAHADSRIQVVIRDQGVGFDPSPVARQSSTGLGIPAIRDRASWLGGGLELQGAVGEGTCVTLWVPAPVVGSSEPA